MKLFWLKRKSLFRKTIVIYLSLSLLLFVTPPAWTNPLRNIVLQPFSLFQRATFWTVDSIEQLTRNLTGGWRRHSEVEELRDRAVALEAKLLEEQGLRLTAEEKLAQYTALRPEVRERSVLAYVTGFSASPLRRKAMLNQGTAAGIVANCPVLWNGTVIGRIEASGLGSGSSSMVLVGDRDCRIAVRCVRTRTQGMLEGLSGNLSIVKYVGRDEDVIRGDVFVTSGLDGIFPPGRFVGKCTKSTNKTGEINRWVELQPARDLSRIEIVCILLPPRPVEEAH